MTGMSSVVASFRNVYKDDNPTKFFYRLEITSSQFVKGALLNASEPRLIPDKHIHCVDYLVLAYK